MVAFVKQMASAAHYLEKQRSWRDPAGVAGVHDLGGEEPDGIWWNPAGLLGVRDRAPVDSIDFQRLCSGFDPRDGETKLTRNAGQEGRSAGMDVEFGADKTISALWAVADPEMRAVIEDAHNHAAWAALGSIIRRYCAWTRVRGDDGDVELVEGELIGAMFQQGTSREGDPQLHTHCTIFNAVETKFDRKFRALYRLGIGNWMKAAGAVYRHQLADSLVNDPGVRMEQYGKDLEFTRIVGVPEALTEVWSKRRRAIDAERVKRGVEVGPGISRRVRGNRVPATGGGNRGVELRHGSWALEAAEHVGDVDAWIDGLTGHEIERKYEVSSETARRLDRVAGMVAKGGSGHLLPDVIERVYTITAGILDAEVTAAWMDVIGESAAKGGGLRLPPMKGAG